MDVASVSTGIPVGVASRNFARRSSREITKARITTEIGPKTSVKAAERLSTTVPVPTDCKKAAVCLSILAMRSATSSAEEAVGVFEVPVQHAFGEARFGGDGSARKCIRTVAQQDAFGG